MLAACLFASRASAMLGLEKVRTGDQLSNNSILSIMQDDDGYVWLGSYDGLNRFDGRHVDVFRHELNNPATINGNIINGIYPAGSSQIWVLNPFSLDLFNTRTFEVDKHFDNYSSLDTWVATDRSGNTFLYTSRDEILFYDAVSKDFKEIALPDMPAKSDVVDFDVIEGSGVWIFTRSGEALVIKYACNAAGTPVFDSWQLLKLHDEGVENIFASEDGFYIQACDGRLWFYNTRRANKSFLADIKALGPQYGRISAICNFEGNLILAFGGSGLGWIPAQTGIFEVLANDTGIFALMPDSHQPMVWCATDGRGVYRLYETNTHYASISSAQIPFLTKPIRTFSVDASGALWIGTKGDGLIELKNYADHKYGQSIPQEYVNRFGRAQGLPDDQIFVVKECRFSPGDKWVASRGPGISLLTAGNVIRNIVHPELCEIHDIFEQNDSILWLASSVNGLSRLTYSPATLEVKELRSIPIRKGLKNCYDIFSLAFNGRSTLYVGCRGNFGVACLNLNTLEYSYLDIVTDADPAFGDVICLNYTPSDMLYVGSSTGLAIVDCRGSEHKLLKTIGNEQGMVNDQAHCILTDALGHVWVSTNKGLVRYMPSDDKLHNIASLPGDIYEFCDNAGFYDAANNRLVFGALNGITYISTGENTFAADAQTPRLLFSRLQINGQKQNINDYNQGNNTIVLPSERNSVTLAFSALDYLHGDNINYSYYTDANKHTLTNLGNDPSIKMAMLPSGTHKLHIRYHSSDSEWPDGEETFTIIVRRPWFASTWALAAYAVLLLLVVSVVIYRLNRRSKRRRQQFENELNRRQQEQLYADRINFFTNIAHELCTPLTMIRGLCDIMRRNLDGHSASLAKYIDSMQQQSEHLNGLVQEILDFRKIEEGGFHRLSVQPVDVAALVGRTAASYDHIAAENKINFEISLDPGGLMWKTDPSCLSKILVNLLSNAFKYTPQGGTVWLNCNQDGQRLVISVRNTGQGIAPEKIATLFDRFTVLDNWDKNSYREISTRHGLGLYICNEITKLIGGEIAVESVPGEYTVFTVSLPELDGDKVITQPDGEGKKESDFDIDGKPQVLIVDDHADMRTLVAQLLGDEYATAFAASAQEALEEIARNKPQLVITDIMMPGTDGLRLIDLIRQDKKSANIPVIVLSAKATEDDKLAGYSAGADAYLTKPFSPGLLRGMVGRLLQRKKDEKDYYHSPASANVTINGVEMTVEDKEFFERVRQVIARNLETENALAPADIARELGVDVRTLYRRFKKCTEYTPTEYVKKYRYAYAARLLKTTNLTVQEIMYRVGLSNKSVFFTDFKKFYGTTPKAYRSAND